MGALQDELNAMKKKRTDEGTKRLSLREELAIRKDIKKSEELQQINRAAVDTINKYQSTISNFGYMAKDDLSAYRTALDSYIDSTTRLRSVSGYLGIDVEEDDAAWQQRIAEINGGYDNTYELYAGFEDEASYNKAVEDIKYTQRALGADTVALAQELETLRPVAQEYAAKDQALNEYLIAAEYPEQARELDRWLRDTEAKYGFSYGDGMESLVREKEKFLDDATRLQRLAALEAVADPESESYDPEFEKKSQYTPQEYTPMSNMAALADNYELDGRYPWQDPLYEAINGNTQAQAWLKNKAAGQVPEDNALGRIFYRVAEGKHELLQMEDSEKQIYNYYANGGDSKAREYYDLLETDLYARQRLADYKAHTEAAKAHPFGESLASIVSSPMKGLSYIGQLGDYMEDGKIDENAPYNMFSYHISDTRGAVAQEIEKGNWGKAGSWLYQQGMGMGDFLMSAAVTGGNQVATLAIMGSGAAADMTIDAKKRGLDDDQALALGTIAGAAEVVTEKIGLDALFDTALRGKSPVTYLLKNAFSEGLEEPTSSLINLMADVIISKDKSQWQQSIQAYKDQGCDDTKAFWKAVTDQAASLGLDALGGFLSGSAMGGGSVAVNSVAQSIGYREAGKAITASEGGVAALQALAAELGKSDADLAKLSSKISDKVAKGDTRQVGRLYAAVQGAVERSDTTALTNKLIEKGYETQTARRVAQVLMEARSGEVTSQEQAELLKALRGDETVMAAFSEALESEESAGYRLGKLQEMMRRGTSSTQGQPSSAPSGGTFPQGKVQEGAVETAMAEDDTAQTQEEAPEAAVQKAVENLNLDDKITATLVQGYTKSGLTSESYIKGVQDAYAYGQNRYSQEDLSTGANTAQLLANVRDTAYFFGRRAAIAQNQRRPHINGKPVTRVDSKGRPTRKRGFVKAYGVSVNELNKSFNDAQGHAYGILNRIAEITGIDIVLFKSKKDASGKLRGGIVEGIDMNDSQGAFSWHNDKIYIDVNAGVLTEKELGDVAKYSMLRTFSHEFTHFIEKHNPVEYANFRELVFETMRQNGHDPEAMIDAYMQQDKKLDREAASREVVAEAMTDILPESSFVEQLAQKHKNLFQTLLDKLKAFVESIKDHFASIGYNRAEEAQALKRQEDGVVKYAEQIVAMFDKIAVQAVERYQEAQESEKNTAQTDGEVQMQIRKAFYSEFDAWDGKHSNVSFTVGTTSDVLKSIGMKDQQIKMHSGMMISKINKHPEITRDIFRQVPDLLENPIIVQFSDAVDPKTGKSKYDDSITVLGELYAKVKNNGKEESKPVLVALNLLPKKKKSSVVLNVAVVKSAYTKEALQQYIDENSILYIDPDKKRTNSWLSRTGLSLPVGENRYGSVRKISYADGKVKVQNAKNMTDMQRALLKAGAIDEFGNSKQHRTSTLTNRDILAETPDKAAQNDMERKYLRQYRDQLAKVQEQEQKQRDLTEQLEALEDGQEEKHKELQFELTRTKNRLDILSKRLKETENAKPMEALVQREASRILAELRKEYGTIPQGEKAVRDDALPVSTDGKNRVSRTARTVKGAKVTTDEFAGLIDAKVAKGELTYLPISNDETTQNAMQYIQDEGWEEALKMWQERVRAGEVSAEMSAIGALLLNNAAQAGDKNTWLDILHDYQMMGNRAAQGLQALQILKKLQPEDKLYMIRRSVKLMANDMHTGVKLKIDESLARQYQEAKTDEERDVLWDEIAQNIANQLPASLMEKWTSLRYLQMLGNLRTQVRNVFGNAAMLGTVALKDAVATGMEQIAYMVTGGQFERTKSIVVSADMMKAAKEDFKLVEEVVMDGGRYNEQKSISTEFAKAVYKKRRIFKNNFLEKYRLKTSDLMDKGDILFSRFAYAKALAGFLKARGVTDSDFSKVEPALLDEARLYAVQEAQEATFRDINDISEALIKLRYNGPNKILRGVSIVGEGIQPFRKTTGNVVARATEYSITGIFKSAKESWKASKKDGTVTGAQLINSWAKTFTGTGLFVLGILGFTAGWLIGGPDDDDELDKFEALYGQQNYAIKFGDWYVTIDWLSPSAIPLFMGAQIAKDVQENGFQWKYLGRMLTSIGEPLIQMSMLQGVDEALENIKYTKDNLGQFVLNSMTNYLLQGVNNSGVGQLERSFEGQRMTTYVDKGSQLSPWLQRQLGKASAKIPGWDFNQIPYINAWGEEQENPHVVLNTIYNLLSPSYVSKGTEDAVYDELTRLNEVQGDENVFPQTPNTTVTYTDKHGVTHTDYSLSADEYVALARAQGQEQRKLVEKLVANASYKAMSDTDKAKAISYAYKYAKEKAQIEVLGRKEFSAKWMREIKGDATGAIIAHVKDK